MVRFVEIGSIEDEELKKVFGFRNYSFSPEIEEEVREIVNRVKKEGDKALFEYSLRFDSVDLSQTGLRVSEEELKSSLTVLSEEENKALDVMIKRVKKYHQNEAERSWFFCDEMGNFLGQVVRAIKRVGIYVPGGKASYPSTVVMNAVPALIAGVEEVVVCTPPGEEGSLNKYILAACEKLGLKEVYRVGGAQAIAALAFGTESISPVDFIAGPGNIYVTLAKKIVYGEVGIDMLAGPSEVVILADDSAKPAFISADLLAQVEHDSHALATLVTPSRILAERVKERLLELANELGMEEVLSQVTIVLTDWENSVKVVNFLAPEHLEIMTKEPISFLEKIENAGAIFIGENSPVAAGDYVAGPSHTLPTGRTARFFSPLSVSTFLKKSSVVFLNSSGMNSLVDYVKVLADLEGFKAHAHSAWIRRGKKD